VYIIEYSVFKTAELTHRFIKTKFRTTCKYAILVQCWVWKPIYNLLLYSGLTLSQKKTLARFTQNMERKS